MFNSVQQSNQVGLACKFGIFNITFTTHLQLINIFIKHRVNVWKSCDQNEYRSYLLYITISIKILNIKNFFIKL